MGGRRLAAANPTLHGAKSHPDPADPLGTPVTTGEQAIEHFQTCPKRNPEHGGAPTGARRGPLGRESLASPRSWLA